MCTAMYVNVNRRTVTSDIYIAFFNLFWFGFVRMCKTLNWLRSKLIMLAEDIKHF